jgi:hypothetical protein
MEVLPLGKMPSSPVITVLPVLVMAWFAITPKDAAVPRLICARTCMPKHDIKPSIARGCDSEEGISVVGGKLEVLEREELCKGNNDGKVVTVGER